MPPNIVGNNSSLVASPVCCRGNLFIEPLPSNGRLFRLHYSAFKVSCHSTLN
jgi:hypothetical protein